MVHNTPVYCIPVLWKSSPMLLNKAMYIFVSTSPAAHYLGSRNTHGFLIKLDPSQQNLIGNVLISEWLSHMTPKHVQTVYV